MTRLALLALPLALAGNRRAAAGRYPAGSVISVVTVPDVRRIVPRSRTKSPNFLYPYV